MGVISDMVKKIMENDEKKLTEDEIPAALRICSLDSSCSDCPNTYSWKCDKSLMYQAADYIDKLREGNDEPSE